MSLVLPAPAGPSVDEYVTARPAACLRPLIEGYSGYRQAGVPPALHRGLPSPYLTMIFTLDEPLTMAEHPDPRQSPGSFETLTGGLHASPALIQHDGSQSGIQVALSPLGARAILGMPAGELASLDVESSELLGPLAARIQDRMRAAASWPERFAAVDELLASRVAPVTSGAGVRPEVAYAWQELLRSGGRTGISELAERTGWSDRHLRAQFAAELGLTPKAAARVIRFDQARRLLGRRARAGGPTRLADLAARCGYYDQAHLDREFRAMAGCAPTAWLAAEFRNIQAGAADLLEGWRP